MSALQQVGAGIELVGLAVTAWGLFRAWSKSANGVPFWPTWLRRAYFKVARLWGQTPKGVSIRVSGLSGHAWAGAADVVVGRTPGRTVAQRLDDLEADLDGARKAARELRRKVERLDRDNTIEHQRLRESVDRAKAETMQQLDRKSLADLRPAVWGLVVAGVGQLLQFIAAF